MPIVLVLSLVVPHLIQKKPTVAFILEPSQGKLDQEIFQILEKTPNFSG